MPPNNNPTPPPADPGIQPTNDPVADITLPGDQPAFNDPTPPADPTPPTDPTPTDAEPPAWFKQWTDNVFTPIQERLQTPPEPTPPADPEPKDDPAPVRKPPKTMEELDQYTRDIISQYETEKAKQQEQETEAQKQQREQVDQYLDEQVKSVTEQNLIPASKDGEKNPYMASLYAAAWFMGTDNLVSVAHMLKTTHDRGEVFDLEASQKAKAPVYRKISGQAGGNAQVGSSMSSTGANPGGPTYEQIHKARGIDGVIDMFNAMEGN